MLSHTHQCSVSGRWKQLSIQKQPHTQRLEARKHKTQNTDDMNFIAQILKRREKRKRNMKHDKRDPLTKPGRALLSTELLQDVLQTRVH